MSDTVPDWLHVDLATQWVPDAVGGAGSTDRPGTEDRRQTRLHVPWRTGKTRVVTDVDTPWRVDLHRAIFAGVSASTPLSPGVFGYRDDRTPYRTDYWQLQERLTALRNAYAWEARTDVTGFFRDFGSVALTHLEVTADAQKRLEELQKRTGELVLPGHRWARYLANLGLIPVDEAVQLPFARWQDDYWIFATREVELHQALSRMVVTAERLELRLSPTKTRIQAVAAAGDRPVDQFPGSLGWKDVADGLAQGRMAFVRNALRRISEDGPDTALPASNVLRATLEADALLPRLVQALATIPSNASIATALTERLRQRPTPWVLGRLLPALQYHRPSSVDLAAIGALQLERHPSFAIQELNYCLTGVAGPLCTPRVLEYAGDSAPYLKTDL